MYNKIFHKNGSFHIDLGTVSEKYRKMVSLNESCFTDNIILFGKRDNTEFNFDYQKSARNNFYIKGGTITKCLLYLPTILKNNNHLMHSVALDCTIHSNSMNMLLYHSTISDLKLDVCGFVDMVNVRIYNLKFTNLNIDNILEKEYMILDI